MTIHARFRLNRVDRSQGYYKAPGGTESIAVESASVQLNAVQGEPFGAYTPSGRIDMFIVNPAAAQVFFGAAIGQDFDVVFTPVHSENKEEG